MPLQRALMTKPVSNRFDIQIGCYTFYFRLKGKGEKSFLSVSVKELKKKRFKTFFWVVFSKVVLKLCLFWHIKAQKGSEQDKERKKNIFCPPLDVRLSESRDGIKKDFLAKITTPLNGRNFPFSAFRTNEFSLIYLFVCVYPDK